MVKGGLVAGTLVAGDMMPVIGGLVAGGLVVGVCWGRDRSCLYINCQRHAEKQEKLIDRHIFFLVNAMCKKMYLVLH